MEMIRVRVCARQILETRPFHRQLGALARAHAGRSNAVLLLDGTLQRAKLDVVATLLVRAQLEEAGRRSVLANRHTVEMNREFRSPKPIARRITAESIDLEIRAHLERRRIDDPAQASHDSVLGGERVL